MTWIAEAAIRVSARLAVQRIDLQSEGLEHLPSRGPVLLAARHYHHFWDGCALLAVIPRPLHVVVTLDWMTSSLGHGIMKQLCWAADWPVVGRNASPPNDPRESAVHERNGMSDALRQRAPLQGALSLMTRDRALLIFPEAYPTLDPHGTPKKSDDEFLAFLPGVLRLAALAERATGISVPIVPVGLEYRRGARWSLRIRLGAPRWYEHGRDRAAQLRDLEADVRRLSGLADATSALEGIALADGRWRGVTP